MEPFLFHSHLNVSFANLVAKRPFKSLHCGRDEIVGFDSGLEFF